MPAGHRLVASRRPTRLARSASAISPSSQLELDRHFDEHVNRSTEPLRRRELPATHRVDGSLIEARTESLKNPDVSNGAVAAYDDLEHDVPGNPAAPRVVGVIRLDLA